MKKMDTRISTQCVREHYNKVAPNYARKWDEISSLSYLFNMRRHRVLELIKDLQPNRLLDVGCGPGVMAESLIARGFDYHGVDLSDEMIRECMKRFTDRSRSNFTVAKLQAFPFESESFQHVLCLGALEYVDDLDEAIEELVRVLAPGGVLLFSMMNKRSPYRIAERLFHNAIEPCPHFTERFANDLLRRHGLRQIDCLYYDFNLLPYPLDKHYPNIALALSKRCELLYRSPLRWLATGFLVKAYLD